MNSLISTIRTNKPFLIYLIIGASTTLFDILLYWFLLNILHIWYLAAGATTGVAIPIYNFFAHRFFTFKSSGRKRSEFPRYVILVIVNYFIGLALLYTFVDLIHLNKLLAKIFVTAVFAFYNFFALKLFVFRK